MAGQVIFKYRRYSIYYTLVTITFYCNCKFFLLQVLVVVTAQVARQVEVPVVVTVQVVCQIEVPVVVTVQVVCQV